MVYVVVVWILFMINILLILLSYSITNQYYKTIKCYYTYTFSTGIKLSSWIIYPLPPLKRWIKLGICGKTIKSPTKEYFITFIGSAACSDVKIQNSRAWSVIREIDIRLRRSGATKPRHAPWHANVSNRKRGSIYSYSHIILLYKFTFVLTLFPWIDKLWILSTFF